MQVKKDRCVSEVIGFIIIFGITITGVTLVTMYGYPLLMKSESDANIKSMEKTMVVLQNDIKNLAYKSLPYRETAIQVGGGTLSVINASQTVQNFEIRDQYGIKIDFNSLGINIDNPFKPGVLQYESKDGQVTIVLENGAVHERYWSSEGSYMLTEPRWFIDNYEGKKTLFINMIKIVSDQPQSRTGIGNVRMTIDPSIDPNPVIFDSDQTPINGFTRTRILYSYDPNNNFQTAWNNYFAAPPFSSSGGEAYVDDIDRLVVKEYTIKIIGL